MALYSIWVLEYARCPVHPIGRVVYQEVDRGECSLPFAYMLIKGEGVLAMVDVGYDHTGHAAEIATEFGLVNWHSPREVLAECGVRPEDVTHAFITHAHFDHIGGSAAFPNATFYIQERELAKWVWALSLGRRYRRLKAGLDPADILRSVELARAGRLVCVSGDRGDVVPGIDLHAAHDTHTWGYMYVGVRNDGRADSQDRWVLAGDLVYRFENLVGFDPTDPEFISIGFASGSQTNNILTLGTMLDLVGGEDRRVIPVHEERLKDRFPSRLTAAGLQLVEVALADGEPSRVA